jgi:hypothetical protein
VGGLSAVSIFVIMAAGGPGAVLAQISQPIVLREAQRAGTTTQTRIELKAQGLFRPGLPPGAGVTESRLPKPLSLEVQTRLIFIERLARNGQDGASRSPDSNKLQAVGDNSKGTSHLVAVRQVLQAASAINGEVRPTAATIRPEVSLLLAERRDRDGPVVVVSPAGPLTRAELELVEGLGDPLALAEMLPSGAVAPGATWPVRDAAAQALCGYDLMTSNNFQATLEAADQAMARVRLKGRIQGSALGGAGTITLDGFFTFDRRLARIDRLEVQRAEIRQPGPIEAGLDVKSSLTVTRQNVVPPATLSDAALARIPLQITSDQELLRLGAPGGKATLLHDRQWHVFWEDPKLMVLKRLDREQVIAQCNLAVAPVAGAGRHQDPNQFRDDVRRALKQRFVQFLGAGEIGGDQAGGFRYKVGVQGREGELGVIWYYYLLASPDGDQLLGTFTLAADNAQAFGDQDLKIVGSLRWSKRAERAQTDTPRGIGRATQHSRQ